MINIAEIAAECLRNRPDPPITLTHKWVPDGAYDDSKSKTRFFIYNGFAYLIVSKMWVDSEGRDKLPDWLQKQWGTYPDLPPKPAKV